MASTLQSNTTLTILATDMSVPDAAPRRIAVEGLRSGADIKSFRRRLTTIICPDAAPAFAVDIYFKGADRTQSSNGVSSKQKFESRVKDCLDAGQPMAINYRLRPKTIVVESPKASTSAATPSTTEDKIAALTKENAELKAQLAAAATNATTPPTAQCLKSTAGGIAQTMASFLAADASSFVCCRARLGRVTGSDVRSEPDRLRVVVPVSERASRLVPNLGVPDCDRPGSSCRSAMADSTSC